MKRGGNHSRGDIPRQPTETSLIHLPKRSFDPVETKTTGQTPLSSVCQANITCLTFRSWNKLDIRITQDFSFQERTSYLLPSFLITESTWTAFCDAANKSFSEATRALCCEYDLSSEELLTYGSLNNMTLNRWIVKMSGVFPPSEEMFADVDRVHILWLSIIEIHRSCDPDLWISPLEVIRICGFCAGLSELISNETTSVMGYTTTIMDCGAPCKIGVNIEPDLPKVFRHPRLLTRAVWNDFGSSAIDDFQVCSRMHSMSYTDRVSWRKNISETLGPSVLVGFHLTESDFVYSDESINEDLGWHAHLWTSEYGRILVKCGHRARAMQWAEYEVVCACFKLLMKMTLIRHERRVTSIKPVELLFPVSSVIESLEVNKCDIAVAAMVLHARAIANNAIPAEIYVPRSEVNRGRYDLHAMKRKLWGKIFTFSLHTKFRNWPEYAMLQHDRVKVSQRWLTSCGISDVLIPDLERIRDDE